MGGVVVEVPEGEERWLIEGTAYYPTRRCFWTGAFWAHDYIQDEPPALKAARYRSKYDAEAVIPTIKSICPDDVHNIAAFGHMFQCGISPESPAKEQPGDVAAMVKRLREHRNWETASLLMHEAAAMIEKLGQLNFPPQPPTTQGQR